MAQEVRIFFAVDGQGQPALGGPWALAEIKGTPATRSITAGTAITLGVPENVKRKALIVQNVGTDLVFISERDDATVSDCVCIYPGGAPFVDTITTSAWYVVAASDNIDLRVLEVSFD